MSASADALRARTARERGRRGSGRARGRGAAPPYARSARTRGRATRGVSRAIRRGRGSLVLGGSLWQASLSLLGVLMSGVRGAACGAVNSLLTP